MPERNLIDDLRALDLSDDELAIEVYRALCNMRWVHDGDGPDVLPWSCTWRSAGGHVADLRNRGEMYLDFYCAGGEGEVSERVREEFGTLGWRMAPWPSERQVH